MSDQFRMDPTYQGMFMVATVKRIRKQQTNTKRSGILYSYLWAFVGLEKYRYDTTCELSTIEKFEISTHCPRILSTNSDSFDWNQIFKLETGIKPFRQRQTPTTTRKEENFSCADTLVLVDGCRFLSDYHSYLISLREKQPHLWHSLNPHKFLKIIFDDDHGTACETSTGLSYVM